MIQRNVKFVSAVYEYTSHDKRWDIELIRIGITASLLHLWFFYDFSFDNGARTYDWEF